MVIWDRVVFLTVGVAQGALHIMLYLYNSSHVCHVDSPHINFTSCLVSNLQQVCGMEIPTSVGRHFQRISTLTTSYSTAATFDSLGHGKLNSIYRKLLIVSMFFQASTSRREGRIATGFKK